MDIQERPEWQQRVFRELEDLAGNYAKLGVFLMNPPGDIAPEDLALLQRQYKVMGELISVLRERTQRFDHGHSS